MKNIHYFLVRQTGRQTQILLISRICTHDDIIGSNPNYNTKATEFLRKKQVFDMNKNIWMSFNKSTIEPW